MHRSFRRILMPLTVAFAAFVTTAASPVAVRAEQVTVFAAASLKTALDEIAVTYKADTGNTAVVSYAASPALAKQIEQGAPADIFISADHDWMSYVAERSLIKPETRTDLLGNAIVIVAPKDEPVSLTVEKGFDLKGALGGGRLAIGAVDTVPAGKYAKSALAFLGVWDTVAGSLAEAENVRAALQFVARGETPLGIVYRTDAAAETSVTIVGTFPAESHTPIVYPMAVTSAATSAAAEDFARYLTGTAAAAIFQKAGFTVLTTAGKS